MTMVVNIFGRLKMTNNDKAFWAVMILYAVAIIVGLVAMYVGVL